MKISLCELFNTFNLSFALCGNQEAFNEEAKLTILTYELNLNQNETTWLSNNSLFLNNLFNFHVSHNEESDVFLKMAIETYIDGSDFNLENYESLQGFIPPYKARMTSQELSIFESMTDLQQLRYLFNAQVATDKAIELLPGIQLNTKADAFRHAYFHGLNTYYIGYNLSLQLGDAHESETPANLILEKTMDLINNARGRELSQTPHIFSNGYGTISVRVYNDIQNGGLMYLYPLNADGTIYSNTILIPTNQ